MYDSGNTKAIAHGPQKIRLSVIPLLGECGLLLKYCLCFRSFELAPSVEAVKASCNLHGREIPNTVIASGFSGRAITQEEATRKVHCVTRDVLSVCHTHMFKLSHTRIFQTRECAVGNPSAIERQTANILNSRMGL